MDTVNNKLVKLRSGDVHYKMITINDVELAVVLLKADVMRMIEEETEKYMNTLAGKSANLLENEGIRRRFYDSMIILNAVRDPDDKTLGTYVFGSVQDVESALDDIDIAMITERYGELMVDRQAMSIDLLTQEELDEIKKHLEVTPLNDLNTVLLMYLKSCHLALPSSL